MAYESDDVPWTQTGPAATHLWAWDDPSFRAQLRPGMILETSGCGYILVREIRREGISQGNAAPLSMDVDKHELLWSWEALQRRQCIISRPSSDEDPKR